MIMRLLSVPWMWSDVDEMSWENEIEEIKEEMCMENQNEMFKGFGMENDTNMKEENVMENMQNYEGEVVMENMQNYEGEVVMKNTQNYEEEITMENMNGKMMKKLNKGMEKAWKLASRGNKKLKEMATNFREEEVGASELVVVVALIVIVLVVAVVFRQQLINIINAVGSKVTNWINAN